MTHTDFAELAGNAPFMAILRNFSVAKTVELAETAWDLGIDLVEVPVQGDESLEALRAVVDSGRARGKAPGAGTIDTTDKVALAADAGATFTVAPGLDAQVAAASLAAGLPHLPGVATASEIQQAQRLGIPAVKAFPAAALGSTWFSAMRGPFPDIFIAATGGMNARNAEQYLAAGANLIAVGSALERPDELAELGRILRERG